MRDLVGEDRRDRSLARKTVHLKGYMTLRGLKRGKRIEVLSPYIPLNPAIRNVPKYTLGPGAPQPLVVARASPRETAAWRIALASRMGFRGQGCPRKAYDKCGIGALRLG